MLYTPLCKRLRRLFYYYQENFDDIVMEQNESKRSNRDDDVTIERVKLTRDEFDNSVFEYEKHKNEMKTMYEERRERRAKSSKKESQKRELVHDDSSSDDDLNANLNNDSDEDRIELGITYGELKEDMESFRIGKPGLEYKERPTNGLEKFSLVLTEVQVEDALRKIQDRMNEIFSDKPTESTTTTKRVDETLTNLNEVYKWITVKEQTNEATKESSSKIDVALEQVEVEADSESRNYERFNQLYSNYFVKYYKHYFDEFYSS